MGRNRGSGWAGLMLIAAVATPVAAHHGWSSYDSSKTLTLEGPIGNLVYQNPHSTIDLTADGKTWHVVLAPITRMQLRGLSQADLAGADTAKIEGYPSTREPNELRAERITIGGETVELR